MDKDKFKEDFKPFSLKKKIAKQVDELNKIDPLAIAEKITGEKNHKDTGGIGFMLQIEKSKKMRNLMNMTDDTHLLNTLSDYTRKIEEFGFIKVYEKKYFSKDSYSKKKRQEQHFIYFHYKFSILLNFYTYNKTSVSGGSFYYNWSPNDIKTRFNHTASGHMLEGQYDKDFEPVEVPSNIGPEYRWDFEKDKWSAFREKNDMWWEMYWKWLNDNEYRWVWSGNHDCRQAIKHNITSLADNGIFLKKWKENPIISLCHSGDWDRVRGNYSENQINKLTEKRMKMLPQDVQDAIGEYKYK